MPRNGSGSYTATANSVNPAVAATTIDASDFNDVLDDLETALTESIARDGQTTTTAAIPFASGIKADTIAENSPNTGVTVDGVLLKDTNITVLDQVIFEGATADAYETTLTVTDPTADRTATIPNATGTFMFNVLEDTTPQLGGPLDTNSQAVNESEGSSVASATTTNIWVTDGNTLHISGTTTITSFGTAPRVGAWRKVIFDGALTLTDGGNLNLPGGANITTAADDIAFVYAETTSLFKILYYKVNGTAVAVASVAYSGHVIQVVNSQDGAVATGTTTMPDDDSIPQITEGDQYLTLSVTPANASNILIIDVAATVSTSASGARMGLAIFQDTTAGALAAVQDYTDTLVPRIVTLRHKMTAGTTSSTAFKVRIGAEASGTTTFNGVSGARKLGGVQASSITIWEVAA